MRRLVSRNSLAVRNALEEVQKETSQAILALAVCAAESVSVTLILHVPVPAVPVVPEMIPVAGLIVSSVPPKPQAAPLNVALHVSAPTQPRAPRGIPVYAVDADGTGDCDS